MKKISILFVLSIVSCCLHAQISLSFKPDKGVYSVQTESLQTITQQVMGMEIPMEQNMGFEYEMAVKSVTDQQVQAQITFKEITYLVGSPYLKMEYDSRNPKEEATEINRIVKKTFDAVIGKTLDIKILPDGAVMSVSGMDAIARDMAKAVETESGPLSEQIGKSLGQQFNEQAWKSSFEQSFKFYPTRPVKKADSWDIVSEMDMTGLAIVTTAKYTMKDVKGKQAYIDFTAVLEKTAENKTVGKLSGTVTGTILMDTATGLAESTEAALDIDGTISVNGVDVVMKIKSKTKNTIKKIK
jgi:hypothetical protein